MLCVRVLIPFCAHTSTRVRSQCYACEKNIFVFDTYSTVVLIALYKFTIFVVLHRSFFLLLRRFKRTRASIESRRTYLHSFRRTHNLIELARVFVSAHRCMHYKARTHGLSTRRVDGRLVAGTRPGSNLLFVVCFGYVQQISFSEMRRESRWRADTRHTTVVVSVYISVGRVRTRRPRTIVWRSVGQCIKCLAPVCLCMCRTLSLSLQRYRLAHTSWSSRSKPERY